MCDIMTFGGTSSMFILLNILIVILNISLTVYSVDHSYCCFYVFHNLFPSMFLYNKCILLVWSQRLSRHLNCTSRLMMFNSIQLYLYSTKTIKLSSGALQSPEHEPPWSKHKGDTSYQEETLSRRETSKRNCQRETCLLQNAKYNEYNTK